MSYTKQGIEPVVAVIHLIWTVKKLSNKIGPQIRSNVVITLIRRLKTNIPCF